MGELLQVNKPRSSAGQPETRTLAAKKFSSRFSVPAARVVDLANIPFLSGGRIGGTVGAKPAPELKGGFSRLGSATPQPHHHTTTAEPQRGTRQHKEAARRLSSGWMSNGKMVGLWHYFRPGDVCCHFHPTSLFIDCCFRIPSKHPGTCQRLLVSNSILHGSGCRCIAAPPRLCIIDCNEKATAVVARRMTRIYLRHYVGPAGWLRSC